MLTSSRFNSRLPHAAGLWESGPALVHSASQEDTEVVLGEGEPAPPSSGHSESSDGGPALHDDVLDGVLLKGVVQLHRDVKQKSRLH